MRRNICLSLCCLLLVGQLNAVPAVTTLVKKIQPDGTEITVYIRGDEKVHWMETLDGYTLLYDLQKYVVYATTDAAGNMIPSTVQYMGDAVTLTNHAIKSFVTELKKGIRYSPTQTAAMQQTWKTMDHALSQQQNTSVTGNKKALCVLMNFKDKQMTKTKTEFINLINQLNYTTDGAKGSVRDYYRETSYGQMDLTVTVAGPYTTKNNMSYYISKPNYSGYLEFAEEAARAANADINLNDFAVNGKLETFHIIFAGYGDESINNGEQIWSHKWQLPRPILLNNVNVMVYSCSPELRGSYGNGISRIGVICHELCHIFGAPDYYDTNENSISNFLGTGMWDLMADGCWNNNGISPAHINMFQKILYGWVTPQKLINNRNVENMTNSAHNPIAYTIEANANGEHYVLENRQLTGFDSHVPGHGLLVYHIHKDALTGNGSNNKHPQQVYPVCANATVAIPNPNPYSYGSINSNGCPFPGSSGKTAFTDDTTPMSFSWNTGTGINRPVSAITESDGLISFYFGSMLNSIKINENDIDVTQGVLDYIADCSEPTVKITVTATEAIFISANGHTYTNGSIIQLDKDITVVRVQIGTNNSNPLVYIINIAKALGKEQPMYIRRWGKTLAVINNPANNGGYKFNDYRWYHASLANTVLGTESFITCKNDFNNYYVEAHSTTTNAWHSLCPNVAITTANDIMIYPNPIPAGHPIYINLPVMEIEPFTVRIYDVNGNLVKQQNSSYSITAPSHSGLFLIQISSPDGTTTVQHIVVI